MTSQTRRAFLQHAPLCAAALGLLPAMPVPAAARPLPAAAVQHLAAAARSMIIHVNDIESGRMTLLVGPHEVTLRSPQLVARFVEAAGLSR